MLQIYNSTNTYNPTPYYGSTTNNLTYQPSSSTYLNFASSNLQSSINSLVSGMLSQVQSGSSSSSTSSYSSSSSSTSSYSSSSSSTSSYSSSSSSTSSSSGSTGTTGTTGSGSGGSSNTGSAGLPTTGSPTTTTTGSPVFTSRTPVQVANAYNNGNGREITINLSDYIKSPNGEPLTYSLAFPKNYSFDSFKKGEYGWNVTSFDPATGVLKMQVKTESLQTWKDAGRSVPNFGEVTSFGFKATDSQGNATKGYFSLQVYDASTGSPVALDLNNDGKISTTGATTAKQRNSDTKLGSTVKFDLDGDGVKEKIEWLSGKGDGLLVDTRKINGSAINGEALFGDQGGKFANGYEKMALLDSNNDGYLKGDELAHLSVWVDDGDARLEAGELHSLANYGITELSTQQQAVKNSRGETLMRSSGLMNGSALMTEDVWFGLKK